MTERSDAPRERLIEHLLEVRDGLRSEGRHVCADTVNEAMDALATAWGQEPESWKEALEWYADRDKWTTSGDMKTSEIRAGDAWSIAADALKNAAPQVAPEAADKPPGTSAGLGQPAESASPCVVGTLSDIDKLLPGFTEVMACLKEQYATSKPAADVIDGLQAHIYWKVGIKIPDAYRKRTPERSSRNEK